ncbi:MAG: hypothetical protein Kow0069_00420 [Promethearchaeota archaeon]
MNSEEDTLFLMGRLTNLMRRERERGAEVYLGLSGGRKTTSAAMALVGQALGARAVVHVLVPPELERTGSVGALRGRLDEAHWDDLLHPRDAQLVFLPLHRPEFRQLLEDWGNRVGKMPKVFLSYAHDDATTFARQLHDYLSGAFFPWYDGHLVGGQDWRSEIKGKIEESDVFVFLVSPQSVRAESTCGQELSLALELGKPVVPVRVFEASVPESIEHLHYVDVANARQPAEALERVRQAIWNAAHGAARN